MDVLAPSYVLSLRDIHELEARTCVSDACETLQVVVLVLTVRSS